MAIKFTDQEPEEPKRSAPKPAIKPDKGISEEPIEPELPRPGPERPAEDIQPDVPGGMPDGQLPFAKTEPKPRGRKKPLR